MDEPITRVEGLRMGLLTGFVICRLVGLMETAGFTGGEGRSGLHLGTFTWECDDRSEDVDGGTCTVWIDASSRFSRTLYLFSSCRTADVFVGLGFLERLAPRTVIHSWNRGSGGNKGLRFSTKPRPWIVSGDRTSFLQDRLTRDGRTEPWAGGVAFHHVGFTRYLRVLRPPWCHEEL